MHLGIRGALRLGLRAQRALLINKRCGFRVLSISSVNYSSGDQNNRDWKKLGLGVAGGLGLGSALAAFLLRQEEPPPAPIADLPSKVDYLLIGAGTASFSAFRSIKAQDVRSKILLVGAEDQIPYMRPPLSKEMFYNSDPELKDSMKFEQWNGRQRSLYYEPEAFYTPLSKLEESSKGGISILKNTWVSALDSVKQVAHLRDRDGKVGSVEYGKCLLATGSRPKSLPEFSKLPPSSVSTFKSFADFDVIDNLIQKGKVSSVAVIGGGFLGTELSCAFGARSKVIDKGFSVTQVLPEEGNMALVLPDHLSRWMTDKVRDEGVHVQTQCTVKSARMDGDQVALELSNGSKLVVDHVIVSVGSEPNIQLAESAMLDMAQGGLKVNSEFKAKKNIWAAGDVASFEDPLLGRRRLEHHDHAVTSGRIAGENMTGGSLKYSKQSMFWSDLGPDIGLEAVGLVDAKLDTHSVLVSKDCTEEGSKEDFDRGVVFYLQDDIIVGVLLWNIFDQIGIARRVLKERRKFEDLTEVAKLFRLVDNVAQVVEVQNNPDKQAEKEAKKEEKEAAKEAKKEEKEAKKEEKEAKKEEKEAAKEAKKEEKEAKKEEKEAKKAEKEEAKEAKKEEKEAKKAEKEAKKAEKEAIKAEKQAKKDAIQAAKDEKEYARLAKKLGKNEESKDQEDDEESPDNDEESPKNDEDSVCPKEKYRGCGCCNESEVNRDCGRSQDTGEEMPDTAGYDAYPEVCPATGMPKAPEL